MKELCANFILDTKDSYNYHQCRVDTVIVSGLQLKLCTVGI